jgi:hypothetical protein
MKLDRFEAATSVRDFAALPGNRLEVLAGNSKDQYSIRHEVPTHDHKDFPFSDGGRARSPNWRK